MSHHDERLLAEQLDAFLDELAVAPEILPAADTATARAMAVTAAAMEPAPAFVVRLEQRLRAMAPTVAPRARQPRASWLNALLRPMGRLAWAALLTLLVVSLTLWVRTLSEQPSEWEQGPAQPAPGPVVSVPAPPSGTREPEPTATMLDETLVATPVVTSTSAEELTVPTLAPTATANVTPTLGGAVPGHLYAYTSNSPDGLWIAETVVSEGEPGYHHVRFVVREFEGSAEWVLVDEERQAGLGFPSPTVLHWLPEARAFFYTEAGRADGCALAPFHGGLYRVALDDGSVSTLSDELAGYLAVSPGGDRVAYQSGHSIGETLPEAWELVVRDLASGGEEGFSLGLGEGTGIVNFVWSPEGTRVLIVTDAGECLDPARSLLLLDLASGTTTTLVEGSPHPLYAEAWPEPGTALLSDGAGNEVWLDVESGTLEGLPESFLPQEVAIEQAIAYCDQGHLAAHGEAQVARAELALPGSERMQEWLGTLSHAADLALWRIELAGKWTIQGPPSEDGVTPEPLPQPTRCTVLLDARSGDLLRVVAE